MQQHLERVVCGNELCFRHMCLPSRTERWPGRAAVAAHAAARSSSWRQLVALLSPHPSCAGLPGLQSASVSQHLHACACHQLWRHPGRRRRLRARREREHRTSACMALHMLCHPHKCTHLHILDGHSAWSRAPVDWRRLLACAKGPLRSSRRSAAGIALLRHALSSPPALWARLCRMPPALQL